MKTLQYGEISKHFPFSESSWIPEKAVFSQLDKSYVASLKKISSEAERTEENIFKLIDHTIAIHLGLVVLERRGLNLIFRHTGFLFTRSPAIGESIIISANLVKSNFPNVYCFETAVYDENNNLISTSSVSVFIKEEA